MTCVNTNIKVRSEIKYVNRHRRKRFMGATTVYAGVLALFVPLALCAADWSSSDLTYDTIFNNTKYAQIRPTSTKRPQTQNYTYVSMNPVNKYFINNNPENSYRDLEYDNGFEPNQYRLERERGKGKLLVGFSHDPFRVSIPETDYIKGVRSAQPSRPDNRGKRGVSHLYNMIYCATGCDPLIFKGYGCYCGFLGSGRHADGIDKCCKLHDQCYENIYCPFYTVYFQPYYWKCYHREPLCALENHLTSHKYINGCAARLCECDRLFAMCLRKYRCPKRRALCRSSPLRLLQNILMP